MIQSNELSRLLGKLLNFAKKGGNTENIVLRDTGNNDEYEKTCQNFQVKIYNFPDF